MRSTRRSNSPVSGTGGGTSAARRSFAALALAAAAGLVAAGAGCQRAPEPRAEDVSTEPLVVDEAMQARDWPQVAANFQAGGVDAGVTRFPHQPQTQGGGAGRALFGDERGNAVLDPVLFIGQSFMLPFTYFVDPPFTKKNHRGVIYEPTYTAMPVLPPDEAPPEAGEAQVQPAPEETAPVTPDAAEASELPPGETPPEERAVEVRPEEMPGEEGTRTETQPADEATPPTEPDPAVIDPLPESTEPAPETTEPMPDVTDPAPESTEPAPETLEPAPDVSEPTPEAVDPLPDATTPETTDPAPEAVDPAPDATEAAPDAEVPAEESTSDPAAPADPAPAEEEDQNK